MADNVLYPSIRWRERLTVETRRQRRTRKTIFRTQRNHPLGKIYSPWTDDPIRFAKFIASLLKHGVVIEWPDDPSQWPAAEVVPLCTMGAALHANGADAP